MSISKNLFAVCVLLGFCLPTVAFAFDETLTFRLNTQGEVEAVVTGFTRGFGCDGLYDRKEFDPPTSVTVTGNNILVVSTAIAWGCPVPRPPFTYQQVANLGHLEGSSYQVVWNEGTPAIRFLAATLNMSDPYSVAAPALSMWALCMLLLSTAGVAFVALRRRPVRSKA